MTTQKTQKREVTHRVGILCFSHFGVTPRARVLFLASFFAKSSINFATRRGNLRVFLILEKQHMPAAREREADRMEKFTFYWQRFSEF